MRSWSRLGRFWAPYGPRAGARSAPNGSWGRPGGPKQIISWAPALPRGGKLIDFILPGGPQEGPGEAPGGHFASIFVTRPAGTKQVRKNTVFL